MQLLDLQGLDARADQLRHQLATLPEHAEIAELERTRRGLDDQRRDASIQVEDLTEEQQKVDADVESVKARRTRDRDRMDQGLITNPKDLERMVQELASLERRITTLEDEELEVMARLEDAQRTLDSLTDQVAAVDTRRSTLQASRDARTQEIDGDLATIAEQRGPVVSGLPEPLVALYDKLRAAKGGVAAAELRARQCGGCRLTLDAAELASFKAAADDEVLRCEECQRILVRTPESGL